MKKYSKFFAVLLAVAMILPGMTGLAEAAPVAEEAVVRLQGSGRVETAVEVSKEAYKTADTVVLAGYNAEVDALAGTLLADAKKAPLLFTTKKELSKETKAEIERLGAKNVFVLGGTNAVSKAVVDGLKKDHAVKVLNGANRAETAKLVAEEAGGDTTHVFLAKGYGELNAILSDALAVGPASAKEDMPVLLTETDRVPASTVAAMKDLGVKNVTIIGGTGAVSKDVQTLLEKDYTVDRINGSNRERTATAIADKFFKGSKTAVVANGYGSPDALVGGYLGAMKDAPILFTQVNRTNVATTEFLEANTDKAFVLGGSKVVDEKVFADIEAVVEGEEVKELKVESVSAINKTGVDVVFTTAAAEDMDDVTIEIKDNKGNMVEVKPITVAKDDKEASFDFVKAVEKQEGIWTIGGVEYDFDLVGNLNAFRDANNQIKLNKALNDLGIKNVKVANIPAYEKDKDNFLDTLDKDKKELTVEAIQEWVNKVNTEALTGKEEEVIVKEVVDAKKANNQIALLQALQNDAFARVNNDWIVAYAEVITNSETSIEGIQGKINGVNNSKFKAVSEIEDKIVDRKELLEEKALQEKYATPILTGTNKGEQTQDTKDALSAIEQQLAIVDVIEATTPTRLKNAVTKLNALLEKEDKINIEKEADGFYEANAKRYISGYTKEETGNGKIDGLKDAEGEAKVVSVAKIEEVFTAVNTEAKTNLIATVTDAKDATALLKALKAFPGLKQVGDTNKTLYWAETAADGDTPATKNGNFKDADNATKIQEAVNLANVTAITGAEKNTVIEKLNVLELKDVVAANAEQYVEGAVKPLVPSTVAGSGKTVKEVQTAVQEAVTTDNKTVIEVSELKAINEAETVAEVQEALNKLADAKVSEVDDYLKVRAVDRDFVAAYVLDKRADEAGTTAKQYDALSDLKTQVDDSVGALDEALNGVEAGDGIEAKIGINGIKVDTAIEDIVEALEDTLDEAFNKLSPTQKVNVAGEFHDKLTFDENGALKPPFRTLAAVKALLK